MRGARMEMAVTGTVSVSSRKTFRILSPPDRLVSRLSARATTVMSQLAYTYRRAYMLPIALALNTRIFEDIESLLDLWGPPGVRSLFWQAFLAYVA